MDANTIVAIFLTTIMVVLCAIALIGGNAIDKKNKEERNAAAKTE